MVAVKEEEEEESDVPPPESQADTQDEDVDMAVEDDIPKVAPKKRKAKKVIPVGRNGLKKKRIVKEKTFMDKDGYMGMPPQYSRISLSGLQFCVSN